jgi:DNA mismatch repair protein MutL
LPSQTIANSDTSQILQIYNTFLLAETEDGLLVIDQHALHERVLYEQIKRRLLTGSLPTQRLLLPELVELSAEQAGAVEQYKDALLELGFDLAPFGGPTWAIHSYPAILEKKPIAPCLLSAVQQITSKSQPPSREQLLQEVMSLMACHAAVRAGDRLTPESMEALLEMRHLARDTHHCPHGRPTALVFSKQELERQFGRI